MHVCSKSMARIAKVADKTRKLKVRLDHLIRRESLRHVKSANLAMTSASSLSKGTETNFLLYSDLQDNPRGLFHVLRKPDFQRETSAWTPEDCVSLLESIVKRLIIPSLIMWESPDNDFWYTLDGAHRISVVRAWMLDDWGDKAGDHYERHEFAEEIEPAAHAVRNLVKARIGSYQDFVNAGTKFFQAAESGSITTRAAFDNEEDFQRGSFYAAIAKRAGFQIQWVTGNYDIA